MTIDIISYTDAQFAALTEEQLLEVQSAQLKKERLDRQLEEDILKEKHRLLRGGIFRSEIFALCKEKLQKEHDLEVENVRDSLLFYLRFSAQADPSGSPYTVDYSLAEMDRFSIVRDYYMGAYEDGNARFEAFKKDDVAVKYLGETYASLYGYLKTYTY